MSIENLEGLYTICPNHLCKKEIWFDDWVFDEIHEEVIQKCPHCHENFIIVVDMKITIGTKTIDSVKTITGTIDETNGYVQQVDSE